MLVETCETCSPWAARSQAQLDNRLRNMETAPTPRAYACPDCGSIAWATTTAFIVEQPGGGSCLLWLLVLSCYAAAAVIALVMAFS